MRTCRRDCLRSTLFDSFRPAAIEADQISVSCSAIRPHSLRLSETAYRYCEHSCKAALTVLCGPITAPPSQQHDTASVVLLCFLPARPSLWTCPLPSYHACDADAQQGNSSGFGSWSRDGIERERDIEGYLTARTWKCRRCPLKHRRQRRAEYVAARADDPGMLDGVTSWRNEQARKVCERVKEDDGLRCWTADQVQSCEQNRRHFRHASLSVNQESPGICECMRLEQEEVDLGDRIP